MYRAVALAGMRRGLDWALPNELARLAEKIDLQIVGDRVLLDGEDVTERVRSSEVTAVTRYAADNPGVRARLVELQRAWARGKSVVTEGRDQGTVAFPEAECKIFITANPEERARRRWRDLQLQGEPVTLEQVLSTQQRRDREDAGRRIAPLAPAADAVLVSTDGVTLDEVVDRLEALARRKM
jgi:cytidylate kinase